MLKESSSMCHFFLAKNDVLKMWAAGTIGRVSDVLQHQVGVSVHDLIGVKVSFMWEAISSSVEPGSLEIIRQALPSFAQGDFRIIGVDQLYRYALNTMRYVDLVCGAWSPAGPNWLVWLVQRRYPRKLRTLSVESSSILQFNVLAFF